MRRSVAVLLLFAMSACSATDGESSGDSSEVSETTSGTSPAEAEETTVTMAESAWATIGVDGAVYTTFLDRNGQYRDFRNGEPLQTGTWERHENGDVCFVPSEEGYAGECWNLGEPDRNGAVRATSADGREIELKRIAYSAPADDEGGE